MANFVFHDHSDIVMRQMNANSDDTMSAVAEKLVESVQKAMLYKYKKMPVDTGRLYDSIEAEKKRSSSNTFTVTVGSAVKYAGYVHEGWTTKNGRRIPGRPYIRDGVMDAQDDLRSIMQNGLSKGFK